MVESKEKVATRKLARIRYTRAWGGGRKEIYLLRDSLPQGPVRSWGTVAWLEVRSRIGASDAHRVDVVLSPRDVPASEIEDAKAYTAYLSEGA